MGRTVVSRRDGRPMLEELEGRVLFSADALGGLAGNLDSGNETALEADLNPGVQQTPLSTSGQAAVPTIHDESFRRELVFIDDTVQDYDALIDGLDDGEGRQFEVVVLNGEEDGLAQISRALAQYSDIDAIHVFSHGDGDSLQVGATDLDLSTLQGRAGEVEAWRAALPESADLLLYGCNLAGSQDGLEVVNLLASLTSADVAASNDLTGSARLGGDWDLEYRVGSIESGLAVTAHAQADWDQVLVTYTVTSSAATGAGSLDDAITQANASTGVDDVIEFNIGAGGPQTILVDAAGLPVISDTVTLDATTQPGYAGVPIITLDGSNTPDNGGINGLRIQADDSVVKGFRVHSFGDEGIEIDGSTGKGDNNTLQNNYVGIDENGNVAGNAEHGIMLSESALNNQIGGTGPNEGNVVAGNGFDRGMSGDRFSGIIIQNNANNNIVEGNIVGLMPDGATAAANGDNGIVIQIASNQNRIGGVDPGAGNVISGNLNDGISIVGSDNTLVQGNFIGTDSTGSQARGNGDDGVSIQDGATGTVVGGTTAAERNIISGNDATGVYLDGATTTGNVVQGNYIGTDVSGTADLGNGKIKLEGNVRTFDAGSNTIGDTGAGEGNIIAFGGSDGVELKGTSHGIAILGNSVFSNVGLGIDLNDDGADVNDGTKPGTSANLGMDHPVFAAASLTGNTLTVIGHVGSAAGQATFANARVEIFKASADSNAEGRTFLGFLTTNASGNFSGLVAVTGLSASDLIVGTATDTSNNTSEFGVSSAITDLTPPIVVVNAGANLSEGATLNIDNTALRYDDTDQPAANVTFTITTGAAHGQLELTSGPGVAITSFTQDDIDNNRVVFVHDGSDTTSDWFNFDVDDGQGNSVTGQMFNIGVNAVNDDPFNAGSLPSDLVFLENTQGKLDLSAIDLSDVDAGLSNLTLTITSDNGHLQTMGGVGLTLGGSQSVLTLTGNLTDLNNFLNDLSSIDYEHATPNTSGDNVDLITIEITDHGNTGAGGGGTIELGTVNIDITGVNDAPTVSATATNPTYTAGDAAVDLFTTVNVSTVEVGQTIEQIVLTVTNVTDGSDETITVDGSVVFLVDGDNDTTGSGYDYIVDVIGNTATITMETNGASVFDTQDLIDGLSYQDSSLDPTVASRVITITSITDSGGGTDTSSPNISTTVDVVALNDAPSVDLNGANDAGINFAAIFTEGGGAVNVTDTDAIISDVDDTSFQHLGINLLAMPDGASELIVVGGHTFVFGTADVVTRTVGSTDFELDFDGTGFSISKEFGGNMPLADLQSLIRGITYENTSQNPTTGNRTIDIEVQDAGGLLSPVATSTITVNAQNDAPVVTTSGGFSSYTEDGPPVTVDSTVTLVDPDGFDGIIDSDQFVGVVSITGNFDAGDTLAFSNTSKIQGNFSGNQLVLTVIGGQTANTTDFQAALRSVTFHSNNNNPSELDRSITFAFDDAVDSSNLATKVVQVTAVDDDAPTQVTNTGSTIAEGGTDTLAAAELAFTDTEQPATSVTFTVTTSPTNGQLELTTAPTVAITSFTQDDIDNNRVVYVHDGSNTISDSFDFDVDDGQGNALTGQSFSLTITAVDDDAPTQVTNTGSTLAEGGTGTLSNAELAFTDSEQVATAITFTVTTSPTNGQLELTTAPTVAITSFTQDDIDNNRVVYVHDGSNTTSDSFNFDVDDGEGNSASGQTFSLTIAAVDDDAPTQVTNTGSTIAEGGTDTLAAAELAFTDTEQPATSVTFTVTTSPTNGQLELTTAPTVAITSFTQDDIDNNRVVYVHDGSNTISDSFDFDVDDGQGNALTGQSFSLTITAVDDDAPTQVTNTGSTIAEGGTDTLSAAELAFTDTEQPATAVTFTVTTSPTNGQLELTTAPTVAITSFTQDDIDNNRVVYIHDGTNTTSDSFDFDVDDGQGNAASGQTFNLTITAVDDDAPTQVTNTGSTIAEGGTDTIAVGELAFTDTEQPATAVAFTVTSSPANGQLELTTNPTVAITSFTQDDLNNNRVVYIHDGTNTTSDSFDFDVDDGQGNAASGQTFNLTITAVDDDAPTQVTNTGSTIAEGGTDTIAVGELAFTDTEQPATAVAFTVTSSPANGQLELTTNPTVAITSFTQDDLNNNRVVYIHDGTNTTSDSFDFDVDDGQGNAASGQTFNLTITAVDDDAPTQVTNTGSTIAEGGTDTIAVGELAFTDTEQPATAVAFTVTSSPANGQLELTTNPTVAITSFTQDDLNNNRVVYIHDGTNTTSDSFNFDVDDGQGNAVTGQSFALTVTPVDDDTPTQPFLNLVDSTLALQSVSTVAVLSAPTSDPVTSESVADSGPAEAPGSEPTVEQAPEPGPHVLALTDAVTILSSSVPPTTPERARGPGTPPAAEAEAATPAPEQPAAEAVDVENEEVAAVEALKSVINPELRRAMDQMGAQMDAAHSQEGSVTKVVESAAKVTGSALSVGSVSWLLRGGTLFASVLSSLPTWKGFDPLPVLSASNRDQKRARKALEEVEREEDEAEAGVGKVLDDAATGTKAQNIEGHD